jgi:hypothetical protein
VLKGLAKSGCQQLIDKGREFLTDEGFHIMLRQLGEGCVGYQVTKLPSKAAAEALCETIVSTRCHRAASASYFRALLRSIVDHDDTVYLQVTSNVGKEIAHDVVVVYENGSFACTEPFYAQMGQPSRHILACFHAQFCNINVLLHYHPRYLRKFSKPTTPRGAPVLIPDLSWQDKIKLGTAQPEHNQLGHRRPKFCKLTSWSWATNKVRVRADEEVLGRAVYGAALRPTTHAMREAAEAAADATNKARNLLKKAPKRYLDQALAYVEAEMAKDKASKRAKTAEAQVDPASGAVLAQPPLPGPSMPTTRKTTNGTTAKRTNRAGKM